MRLRSALWMKCLLALSCGEPATECLDEPGSGVLFSVVDACSGSGLCEYHAEVVQDGKLVLSSDIRGDRTFSSRPPHCQFGLSIDDVPTAISGVTRVQKAGYTSAEFSWEIGENRCFKGTSYVIPIYPDGGCK